MWNRIWPIALVVLSNTLYQVCAKRAPQTANPFASLTVTYLVGAAASVALYYALNRQGSLIRELGRLNWSSFLFGIIIVGLEAGWIYAYRAGWQVSVAPIVQSAFVAIILIVVGVLCYGEALSWNKVVGIAVCIVGMLLINLK